MFPWETTSWKCPACEAEITVDDFQEMRGFYCRTCGVHLRIVLKGHWAYVIGAAVLAFAIAFLQGLEGIAFVVHFLIYLGIAALTVVHLTWPLMLPKKFVVGESSFQTLGLKRYRDD